MDFAYSERCKELQARLLAFMDEHIYPNEGAFAEEIAANARDKGTRWLPLELVEHPRQVVRGPARVRGEGPGHGEPEARCGGAHPEAAASGLRRTTATFCGP